MKEKNLEREKSRSPRILEKKDCPKRQYRITVKIQGFSDIVLALSLTSCWSSGNFLTSLSFNFLICNMETMVIFASQDCREDNVGNTLIPSFLQ